MINDYGYWITMSHLTGWSYEEVNSLIVKVFHENKSNWSDFFALNDHERQNIYNLTPRQTETIANAVSTIANNSFLAEDLLSQGYKLITLTAPEYPVNVKRNLGKRFAPPIFYTKGNLELMNKTSTTIVVTENCTNFNPKQAATIALNKGHILICGQHENPDKQTMDIALKCGGSGVIILSHGITKFSYGFKNYYKHIASGKVLVISPFASSTKPVPKNIPIQTMVARGMASNIDNFH